MRTITLEQFYTNYFTKFPKSSYRIGQHFLNVFIKDDSAYSELWNEKDVEKCKDLIWKIILDYDWDADKLPVLREELL